MKRFTVLFILAVLIVLPAAADATPGDHPVIGRFPGSSIIHQEISRYSEYEVTLSADSSETVQGEVWLTLYDAPDDSSTFSVYSAYKDFLTEKGYEILLAYKPGETSCSQLIEAYDRGEFADHGNFGYPAIFSNGNDTQASYLSARKQESGGTIYVSIAIAAGWREYPQYKVDVIETGGGSAVISSIGSAQPEDRVEDSSVQADTETAASGKAPVFGRGAIEVQAGYSLYTLVDPGLAGDLTVYEQGTSSTVSGGYRNITGPYGRVTWFPSTNLGIGLDVSRLHTSVECEVGDGRYESTADFTVIRGMGTVRVTGKDYPVTLSASLEVGVMIYDLGLYSYDLPSVPDIESDDMVQPVISIGGELGIPIFAGLSFVGGLEYLVVPFDELELTGDDYSEIHYDGNMGGFKMQVGLSYSFKL